MIGPKSAAEMKFGKSVTNFWQRFEQQLSEFYGHKFLRLSISARSGFFFSFTSRAAGLRANGRRKKRFLWFFLRVCYYAWARVSSRRNLLKCSSPVHRGIASRPRSSLHARRHANVFFLFLPILRIDRRRKIATIRAIAFELLNHCYPFVLEKKFVPEQKNVHYSNEKQMLALVWSGSRWKTVSSRQT